MPYAWYERTLIIFYKLFFRTQLYSCNVLISEANTDKGLTQNFTKGRLYHGFQSFY